MGKVAPCLAASEKRGNELAWHSRAGIRSGSALGIVHPPRRGMLFGSRRQRCKGEEVSLPYLLPGLGAIVTLGASEPFLGVSRIVGEEEA